MRANLHLSCVLTVEGIEFFYSWKRVGTWQRPRSWETCDSIRQWFLLSFDAHTLLRTLATNYGLLRKSSWILVRDIVQASKMLWRHSGVARCEWQLPPSSIVKSLVGYSGAFYAQEYEKKKISGARRNLFANVISVFLKKSFRRFRWKKRW